MIYVTSTDQLSTLIDEGLREPLLLGGELVFTTNDREAVEDLEDLGEDRYVVQPKRKASKGRSSLGLYLALDRQAAELAQRHPNAVTIAADHYLAYGLSRRENVIVVGGGMLEDGVTVNLEGMVFTDNALVETFERNANLNGMMIDLLIKEISDRYPEHGIHWCDPLPEPPFCDISESENFTNVGPAAVSGTIKRKIIARTQGIEEGWEPVPAILAASVGLVLFSAVALWSWMKLENERDMYHSEVSGYEESYRNSSQSLELLRHRDFLLRQENATYDVIDIMDTLLSTVSSLDGVVIHRLEIFSADDRQNSTIQTSNGTTELGEFVAEISVPQIDPSARVQVEQIIKGLSNRSGMNFVVLSHQKHTIESNGVSKDYWQYKLSGGRPSESI